MNTIEDWAAVVVANAREDALNGYGDYVAQKLIKNAGQWADPFDRQRIWAVIRELSVEPTEPCPNHKGEQEIADWGAGNGFAGGTIYWTTYACGCQEWDESGDVAAAY
jgi:hypothetical protein